MTPMDIDPGADAEEDATSQALFRTTKALSDKDREQVLRFAEFLRTAGTPPRIDDNPAQP